MYINKFCILLPLSAPWSSSTLRCPRAPGALRQPFLPQESLPEACSGPALAFPLPAAPSSAPHPTRTRCLSWQGVCYSSGRAVVGQPRPSGYPPRPSLTHSGPCSPWEPRFSSHLLRARPCATMSPACEEHSESTRKPPGVGGCIFSSCYPSRLPNAGRPPVLAPLYFKQRLGTLHEGG